MISRHQQAEIIKDLQTFPCAALIGPRQVGKSTLAKQILGPKDVYLDLERPSDLAKLNDPELFFDMHKDGLICLDEVQMRPDLFQVLRLRD